MILITRDVRLCVFALLAMVSSVHADDMIKGCYERVYDKAHMARHVGQLATAMQLQIGIAASMKGQQDCEEDQDSLAVRGLNKNDLYYGATECRGSSDEASCTNPSNAERFSVTRTRNGIKLNLLSPLTLTIEGTFDRELKIPPDAENRVYALVKVSDGNCAYFNKR